MKVVRKINNNAAVCIDSKGVELVAFGNGIGFPKTPYELSDLSKINMTFYRLNPHYFQLLTEIPDEVFGVSAEIVDLAKRRLHNVINANLIFTLADHINFTLIRMRDYAESSFPFSYDVAQLYPEETKVAKLGVGIIERRFHLKLPATEVTALAMHLVNSQKVEEQPVSADPTDALISKTIEIIEQSFDLHVDEGSFTYNRFALHMRYYIKRSRATTPQDPEDVSQLIKTLKNDSPSIYACAKKITDYVDVQVGSTSTEDERFYVAIYIRRIINHQIHEQKEDS